MTDASNGWPAEAREAVARAFWQSALPPYPYECVGGDERIDLDEGADAALAALAPYHAAALKAAYQQGWSDRESDLLAGIDRVYGAEKPDGK
jgi:hypothetical protein